MPVKVFGYALPNFKLDDNFEFISMAQEEYPASEWSNSLIQALEFIDTKYVLIMLEDYWINRPVDVQKIETCFEYIKTNDSILGIDLSGCTAGFSDSTNFLSYRDVNFKKTSYNQTYKFHMQSQLWRTSYLYSVLKPFRSPWQTELYTSDEIRNEEFLQTIGSSETIVKYQIAMRARDRKVVHKSSLFSRDDRNYIMGRIPRGYVWLPV